MAAVGKGPTDAPTPIDFNGWRLRWAKLDDVDGVHGLAPEPLVYRSVLRYGARARSHRSGDRAGPGVMPRRPTWVYAFRPHSERHEQGEARLADPPAPSRTMGPRLGQSHGLDGLRV